ncbi:hypothetical protein TNCV_3562061 [Trichonephila clavipes]|nr:hypothetical protein TNCV_3562061 [Trichonephila clavipes]
MNIFVVACNQLEETNLVKPNALSCRELEHYQLHRCNVLEVTSQECEFQCWKRFRRYGARHDSIHTAWQDELGKMSSAKQNSGRKEKFSRSDRQVLKRIVMSKKQTTAAKVNRKA